MYRSADRWLGLMPGQRSSPHCHLCVLFEERTSFNGTASCRTETEMPQVVVEPPPHVDVQPPPQFVDPVVRERIPKFSFESITSLPYH
ncbi:hypothetical protein Ddye_030345 [Dipteronia dyeriana]|uniref:Uncharacterized protein n=1 Tax=Dipteronia dyeriana TaxID=168575 RepID=A0AAD9WMM7_9ROSI|nr:hypothetical protein Ddye_030345 [Dipteronia dyeriana]